MEGRQYEVVDLISDSEMSSEEEEEVVNIPNVTVTPIITSVNGNVDVDLISVIEMTSEEEEEVDRIPNVTVAPLMASVNGNVGARADDGRRAERAPWNRAAANWVYARLRPALENIGMERRPMSPPPPVEVPLEEPQRRNLNFFCMSCTARFACGPELRWHLSEAHALNNPAI